MRVALIGGIDRLSRHYRDAACAAGVRLEVFNRADTNLAARIRGSGAVVVFTGNVSHRARDVAFAVARALAIPVYQHHSSGICALRKCLSAVVASRQSTRPVEAAP